MMDLWIWMSTPLQDLWREFSIGLCLISERISKDFNSIPNNSLRVAERDLVELLFYEWSAVVEREELDLDPKLYDVLMFSRARESKTEINVIGKNMSW